MFNLERRLCYSTAAIDTSLMDLSITCKLRLIKCQMLYKQTDNTTVFKELSYKGAFIMKHITDTLCMIPNKILVIILPILTSIEHIHVQLHVHVLRNYLLNRLHFTQEYKILSREFFNHVF